MQTDNRNMILAIVLSMIVLFGWQFFIAGPQLEQAQRQAELQAQQQAQADQAPATPSADGSAAATPADGSGTRVFDTRDAAVVATPRVKVDTPALSGSINLMGGRLDDLLLKRYHETVDPTSPNITLLTPAGAPN